MNGTSAGIRLLWTAGWDSTFRLLVALLVRRKSVQPYYLIDPDRKSTPNELQAMQRIAGALGARFPDASSRLSRPITAAVADLRPDDEITSRFERLRSRSHLGGQYDWLARFAKQQGVSDLELAIHRDDKAAGFLQPFVVRNDGGGDPYFELRSDVADPDLQLFQAFRFPVFDMTKLAMQRAAMEHGFVDLMELTWFCHLPTPDGRPCGRCNPCRYTMEEGLGRRIPLSTRLRNRRKRIIQTVKSPLGAAARWAGLRK